jgi:hypothetical protein
MAESWGVSVYWIITDSNILNGVYVYRPPDRDSAIFFMKKGKNAYFVDAKDAPINLLFSWRYRKTLEDPWEDPNIS